MSASPDVIGVLPLVSACRSLIPGLHRYCRDPWTLIGSAAAWFVGAKVEVADVDVLTTARDARTLAELWCSRIDSRFVPAAADRFRSCFTRYDFEALPVEVMGGLEVNRGNGWEAVKLSEIVEHKRFDLVLHIPSVADQIRILNIFGRPKDVQRATLLEAIDGHPGC